MLKKYSTKAIFLFKKIVREFSYVLVMLKEWLCSNSFIHLIKYLLNCNCRETLIQEIVYNNN